MNSFSFTEYKKIIRYYKKFLKPILFHQIKKESKNFFTVRHDVEFSTERALELARIESKDLKIKASYFFQITNNSYNLFSYQNKKILNDIKNLGHKIGIHFNYKGKNSKFTISKEFYKQVKIFKEFYKFNYKFFSPHRPSKSPYLFSFNYNNFKNTYNKIYFNEFEVAKKDPNKIIYLVDSRHVWKYLHPLNLNLKKHKKVHLTFHPDAWSKNGYNKRKNYLLLQKEKSNEFIKTLREETDYLGL